MQSQIFLLFLLLFLNAFFAASEVALISLKQTAVKRLKGLGGARSRAFAALSDDTGRFLATVQVGVTLAGFLASAFAANSFSEPLTNFIVEKLHVTVFSREAVDTFAVVIITVILSFLSLVFGELVPKQIGLRFAESFALNAAIPIDLMAKITAPFVWVLNRTVSFVMRAFGKQKDDSRITEEEIRIMVDMGEEKGAIESDEKRMIDNVFALNDITASEVMTHRGVMTAIDLDAPPSETEALLMDKEFVYFPVFQGSIDNIIGVITNRDYFLAKIRLGVNGGYPELRSLLRKPCFAPKGTTISRLLKTMQASHFEMAILLDEFGGTAGMVTLADLLEEIVGDLHDDDEPEDEIYQLKDGTWRIGGRVRVTQLNKEISVDLPDNEHFDTVGGLLMTELPELPAPGSTAQVGDCELKVLAVDDMRITQVGLSVRKKKEPEEMSKDQE